MSILVISKSKAPTTAKRPGQRASNRPYDFYFPRQNKILTFPPAEWAEDWAATVQEPARVLAEPVWAVTVDLALVRSRVMSNRIDWSITAILDIGRASCRERV